MTFNWNKSKMIQLDIPARHYGQQSMIGYAATPLMQVRVAFVGMGKRGQVGMKRWQCLPDTEIVALCDLYRESLDEAIQIFKENNTANKPLPATFSGPEAFKTVCKRSDVNLIYICTDWQHHVDIALEAMRQGKHVAIEVPAAMTLDEIWQLVDTSEQTRCHCIMLENTVYDYFESATLNMARHGMFGEIIHAEGGYLHNLGENWETWRIRYNQQYRGDNYPTHGFGPACQLFDIHRTDMLDYLVSVDTASFNGPLIYERMTGERPASFAEGDHTTTVVRTRRGKTILIKHDVMTTQPYSREYLVCGTEGFARKYPKHQLCLTPERLKGLGINLPSDFDPHAPLNDELTHEVLEMFVPDYMKHLENKGKELDSRGGMAYFMDWRLSQALLHGQPLDMDVYDLAEWCSLIELSRISLAHGSEPVAIPDFTRGSSPFLQNV